MFVAKMLDWCIESQSQSEGGDMPRCNNSFETARLGIFAARGSPRRFAYV